jgi:hypothetical protein
MYLFFSKLTTTRERITGDADLNRKMVFALVATLALIALGVGVVASAASATSNEPATDVAADIDAIETETPETGDLEDDGVDSNHEFEGEEEGEF